MTDASHARIDSLDAYKSNDLLAADLEQTSEWIQTLYQHCLRGNGPLNIAGTPGCTYVYQRHTHWLGVEHIIPATNYFSSFSSVSAQPAALDCSLICQDLFDSNWHMATLCLADEADPLMQHCQSYLTTQGLPYQLNRMFTNWQLRWSDSVAAYFAQLPSQLRNTLTRKKNKLAKQGLDWRCQLLTTREEFDQHFHEYRAIYELSWKPKEEHIDFIEAFSQQAAQNGCAGELRSQPR